MSGRELVRRAFHALLLRPFVRGFLGVAVEGLEHLPEDDPFLLVANHNSHLDTPILLSLFPLARLSRVRPVAAADYWLSSPLKRWISETLFNVLPIERRRAVGGDPLAGLREALARGDTLLLFPEGTRGDPEVMGRFHSGAARLAAENPSLRVLPVHLANAGRALPRGRALLVPFICRVTIGAPLSASGRGVKELQGAMEEAVRALGG